MKKALFLIIAALLSGCVDRGQCLSGQTVTIPASGYMTFVDYGNGVQVPIWNEIPESEAYQCDLWEFPNGRPKSDKKAK